MNNFRYNLPRVSFGLELETHRGDVLNMPLGFVKKSDGSINGWEFVTPPLRGRAGLATLKDFMGRGMEIEVNRSCGLHAHFGMADRSVAELMNIYSAYLLTQQEWFQLVDGNRQHNCYCERFDNPASRVYDTICYNERNRVTHFRDTVYSCGSRYKWMNIKAFNKFGTFENRLFQGTWDYDKVARWVVLNLFFIQGAAKAMELPLDGSAFLRNSAAFKEAARQVFATACFKTNKVLGTRSEAVAA